MYSLTPESSSQSRLEELNCFPPRLKPHTGSGTDSLQSSEHRANIAATRDSNGISDLPLIQVILYGQISCISVSLEILLISLAATQRSVITHFSGRSGFPSPQSDGQQWPVIMWWDTQSQAHCQDIITLTSSHTRTWSLVSTSSPEAGRGAVTSLPWLLHQTEQTELLELRR